MPRKNSKSHTPTDGVRLFFKRTRFLWLSIFCILIVLFISVPHLSSSFLKNTADPMHFNVPSITSSPALKNDDPTTPTQPEITTVEVIHNDEVLQSYPELKLGDETESVSQLQEALMELGFFDYGEVTQYFGTVTEDAVKLFQRTLGIEITGIADARTQTILYSENAPSYTMKKGDQGADVRSMQSRLMELGYYTDKINGYFGVATERAVVSFQRRNKLDQDGVITLDSRDLLYSPNAKYLVDPTPTPTLKPTPTSKPKPTPTPVQSKPTPSIYIPEVNEFPSTPVPNVPSMPVSTDVSSFLTFAQQQLGKPYVWSEEGPDSFDCSGLVYYCLKAVNKAPGRYNALGYSQVSRWTAVPSISQLQPGDLVFFKSDTKSAVNHTGIYLGGNRFIHASSSQGKVVISQMTGYYNRNFIIGRRVF